MDRLKLKEGLIGYLAAGLLAKGEGLNLLIRAKSTDDAWHRLWKSLQLHMDFDSHLLGTY